MIKKLTPIVAIIAIAGLAALALIRNIDGVLLAGVFIVIAGIAGYTAPHPKPK